jgi:protein required for attachment to host cells
MTSPHWILAADERAGRLLRLDRGASGHARVVVEEEILDSWQDHEHGRPSPRSGKGGHTYASRGHEDETRRERFAKEVAVWLERRTERQNIDRIAVFAPPRFLGALRDAWSPRLALRVDEHHGDLAHLGPVELAEHDAILELLAQN